MKIEILRERANKPLRRKEVEFRIDHIGGTTPSRPDVRNKIAAKFDADPETVVVKILKTVYGAGITHGRAHIYENKSDVRTIEHEYLLKRHEKKEEAGA